jgi:hypothetical protein
MFVEVSCSDGHEVCWVCYSAGTLRRPVALSMLAASHNLLSHQWASRWPEARQWPALAMDGSSAVRHTPVPLAAAVGCGMCHRLCESTADVGWRMCALQAVSATVVLHHGLQGTEQRDCDGSAAFPCNKAGLYKYLL